MYRFADGVFFDAMKLSCAIKARLLDDPPHDLVYDICREAVKQQRPLLDLLAESPQISAHLDRAALARLCDPANYLGQSGVMVDRVLATLR